MQVSITHVLDDPKHVGGGSGRNEKSVDHGGGVVVSEFSKKKSNLVTCQ